MLLSLLFSSLFAHALTNSQPAKAARFEQVVSVTIDGRSKKPMLERIQNTLGLGGTDASTNYEEASGICTATLLSPRLLITAAHCTAQAYALNLTSIKLRLGRQKLVTNKRTGKQVDIGYANYFDEEVEVAAYGLTPSLKNQLDHGASIYKNISSSEDISIIVLKSPLNLPPDFPFAELMPQNHLPAFQGKHAGQSQFMVVSVNYWDEKSSDRKRFALLEDMRWQKNDFYYSRSRAHVQPTDSGGPVYGRLGDDWKIVGVVKGSVTHALVYSNDIYNGIGSKICKIAQGLSITSEEAKVLCP